MTDSFRRAALLIVLASAVGRLPGPADPPPSLAGRRLSLEDALRRLPGRNQAWSGLPGDALNLVFVGAEEKIIASLASAGWTRVPRSMASSIGAGLRELARGRWPAAFPPMHGYRLFGKLQDINFSIPTRFPLSRHHFRLWRSPFTDPAGRPIWWGSADYDVSIRWRDLSHRTDPDTTRERDFVAATLKDKAALRWLPLPQIPKEGENDRGYAFRNDGRALLAVFTF